LESGISRAADNRPSDSYVPLLNALMSAQELHNIEASDLTELTSATPNASPERVANSKLWATEDRPDSVLPITTYNKNCYHLVAQIEALR